MLVGSCADNWSVQLLDESLVRVTRASSCSRTLVRITNCLRPGALGPGITGWKIRVVSCSVHQRTYAGSGIQCPAPRTLVRILVGHSCADNWNAQVLELILCGQPECPVAWVNNEYPVPNLVTVGVVLGPFLAATRSQHLVTTLKDLVRARKSEGQVWLWTRRSCGVQETGNSR